MHRSSPCPPRIRIVVPALLLLGSACSAADPPVAVGDQRSLPAASAGTTSSPGTTGGSISSGTVRRPTPSATTPGAAGPGSGSADPPVTVPPLSGDFCADIRTLDALDEDDRLDMGSSRSEAFALVEAYFAGLRAEAPPELRASIDRLLAVVTELVDLPDDDPESLGKAFALLFAPDVLAEAKKLNDYSRDVCGLAEEVFPPGGIGPDDGAKGDEDGEPSLMEKVEMANEDASWWEHKRGHSMLTSFREAQVSIFGDFDELEALAACEAVVAAASTDYSTLKVTITEADTTTVLVTRDASTGDTCRAT